MLIVQINFEVMTIPHSLSPELGFQWGHLKIGKVLEIFTMKLVVLLSLITFRYFSPLFARLAQYVVLRLQPYNMRL